MAGRALATESLHKGNEKRNTYGQHRRSTQKRFLLEELQAMTIEELKVVALEKAPNRCATERALEAQKMIYKKQQWGY